MGVLWLEIVQMGKLKLIWSKVTFSKTELPLKEVITEMTFVKTLKI